MKIDVSNLSKSPKTVDVIFYRFGNMLRQLIYRNNKIPFRDIQIIGHKTELTIKSKITS